ncbi:na+-driven multidrug efflux pump [Stylonychia lemnae]|uniref:Na+-driven multidrug efflux pump n=1 Tax=Stylonychia lemnae TaxID=5949 RepID=A0A078A1U1_STYLE|nr:na+-driven multidrug efflux pump [Stylonychia lemnae]|eukprot:CDW74754.1 na+-driven multidrug efflux pump [Stylonychia lemnae]
MDNRKIQRVSNYDMIKDILKIAIPASLAQLSFGIVDSMNLIFVGFLGDPTLIAGVGIGTVYLTVFGIITLCGLNTILSTLVSQSYGQGNLKLCGTYLNRGRIVITLAFIPVAIIMLNAKYFFEITGVQRKTSEQAQLYIWYMLPGLFLTVQFDLLRVFVNSFGKTYISMYVQIIACCLHYLWSYLFINHFGMKLQGTAYSNTLTQLTSIILIVIFINFEKDLKAAFFWPDSQSFVGLWNYTKKALPAMFLWAIEAWTFAAQTLMVSTLSNDMAAAQSILHSILMLAFMIITGNNNAASALIGKFIGSNEIPKAKAYLRVLTYFGLFVAFIQWFIIFFFGKYICQIFTDDLDVQILIQNTTNLLAFAAFFDCTMSCLSGVIRGLGIMKRALVGIILVFYTLGIPLQCYLLFKRQMGLFAIWTGMLVSQIIINCYYLYLIHIHTDWNKQAEESGQRAMQEKNEADVRDKLAIDKKQQLTNKLVL